MSPNKGSTSTSRKGNNVTVLSIDGGSIRSIIVPEILLASLESKLQILMAVSHISKEDVISEAQSSVSQLIDMIPMDSQNMLVLSLGKGAAKQEFEYGAAAASKWSLFNWVCDNPMLDIYLDASSDAVDI